MKSKRDYLWLWVVLAFVLLISAWSFLIYVASKYQPETISLEYHE